MKLLYFLDMLNKKTILMILSIAVISGATIGGGYYLSHAKTKVVSPLSLQASVSATPIQEELTTWEDPSEFSFVYPKGLKLNQHDEDKINYAHLELTSDTHPGRIIFWAKDTNEISIDNWAKKNDAKGALDTTLGDEKAKKILITDPSQKIITSALHNGYLYQAEGEMGDDYWKKVYGDVLASYKFTSTKPSKNTESVDDSSTSSDDSQSSYDEEETIQ